jgi:hypothetical protein
LSNLIGECEEFSPLVDNVKIRAILRVKLDEHGEQSTDDKHGVALKKTPPHLSGYSRSDYVLVVDYGLFMNDADRLPARMHQALMQIDASTSSDGVVKTKARKPDVVTFQKTVQRYGAIQAGLHRELLRAIEHSAEEITHQMAEEEV